MPIGRGTNYGVLGEDGVTVEFVNQDGNATRVRCATASIPSAVAGYAVGCELTNTTTGLLYINTGTVTSATFTIANVTNTGNIGYYAVTKTVTGTTPVNVFSTTNGFAATVTGILVVSAGATNQTITIADTAGTVATVTSSSTTGNAVGATSLSNTSLTTAGTFTVVSGSAADTSKVTITFTTT